MRENKGFSLIEIVVVMAIISILTVTAAVGIQSLGNRQVTRCIDSIETYLGKTKVAALAQNNKSYIEIYQTADGCIIDSYVSDHLDKSEKIGNSDIEISYYKSGGIRTVLTETERLKISFKRDSGALMSLEGEPDTVFCQKIEAAKGTITKTIVLVEATGKFYVE